MLPVITVDVGHLNNEQKKKLVINLTKEASNIMETPEKSFTVLIKENDKDNIGFGLEIKNNTK